MSPNMVSVQMAILDITKACLEELQQANPSVSILLYCPFVFCGHMCTCVRACMYIYVCVCVFEAG